MSDHFVKGTGICSMFKLCLVLGVLIPIVRGSIPNGAFGVCSPGTRFRGGNGVLEACDGSAFVPRGINLQFGDNPTNAIMAFTPIAADSRSNMLRVELRTDNTGPEIKAALEAVLSLGMVPLLMLWDASTTCGTDIGQLNRVTDNWLRSDWKQVVQDERYAPYTLINIVNEFGVDSGSFTIESYRDAFKTQISKMRAAGYTHPLSINAFHCGQHVDSFTLVAQDNNKTIGQDLLDSDPLKNLIFSYHGYYVYWNTSDKIAANVKSFKEAGFPWLITEHGCSYASGSDISPHKAYWEITAQEGVGVLAWSWHGNGNPALDMSSTYKPYTATPYGKDIIDGPYGTKATAKLCTALNPQILPDCPNDIYRQCNGSQFTGRKCCPPGLTCLRKDEYFSSCELV
eukprot:TRINITY_DN4299_c0_g1_i1.p1 TRINITY_DN4299_c0_g1~~TRINITY_DN4299_c0_g1_i1.p1  ORF type:complete len:399 (-),score=81.14 TRINITY_DN4299_c0_g1_i1:57-1253(-)